MKRKYTYKKDSKEDEVNEGIVKEVLNILEEAKSQLKFGS